MFLIVNDYLNTAYGGIKKAIKLNFTKNVISNNVPAAINEPKKQDRIFQELRDAGISNFSLRFAETKYLVDMMHESECIKGAVYGFISTGFVLIVATDKRLIYLDKKPFFSNVEESTFDVISGVSLIKAWPFSTLTVFSRVANYALKTWNTASSQKFISYIEDRCLEQTRYMPRYMP
jgi:hypothetical protein